MVTNMIALDNPTRVIRWFAVCFFFMVGCSAAVAPAASPTPTHLPTPVSTDTAATVGYLDVNLVYPSKDSELEMGQSVRFIVRVVDARGNGVSDANVILAIQDSGGKTLASFPAAPYTEDSYRTDPWTVPHKTAEGTWHTEIEVRTGSATGNGSGAFHVKGSTSDILLAKYGFWLDAPTMKGIAPQLYAERGDAHNGMIRWGGFIPGQHVLAENWIEVHWREGNYGLESVEAVRRFMLAELGDLGFTPVRDIGPFQPMQFKQWKGWRVGARGQVKQDQMEWAIFYAPEVDKTYAIATTVVLPPAGGDPHAAFRDSFAIFPDIHASGIAPEPLPRLRQAPELTSPPLGTRVQGASQPITLQWKGANPLASDEFYEVMVDYNYREANPTVTFTTRDSQITLPESLYHMPNCHVFNWQVRVMRQTGTDAKGQPAGEPVTYNSLYWYMIWSYPPDQPEPFPMMCPNSQF
ncbi:MAG TPA: hypothetical protein VF932_05180 [Anaerolineae bacterium]